MVDLKQIAVAIAVAILFALFIILLTDLVYEEPKYSDYCENGFKPIPVTPIEKPCYEYGEEYQQCVREGGVVRWALNESDCRIFDRCDFCNLEYQDARKVYTRNVFLIAGIIGLASIFIGTLWKIEFLGTGFMFGGIILLFYATVRFFGDADKLLRVIIVFAELLIVIWIGYRKLYLKEKKKGKKS